ncbi:hypothetical protein [uncultured Variovorax sp.]|uniref:DUF6950 family protein n=1 Tax=uncultured Variovorax sp. TaxID=114708 RepID=UPI0025F218C7|nr:hypothetical protein [uncultured Variovorax sp.]
MKLPDWQKRFSDFGKARASMPFAWGSNDCCTFAAAAVQAMTGKDPMAGIPPYDNALAAARLIEEGGGLKALATSLLGEPVAPVMASVGDVVLVLNDGREALGICNGTAVAGAGPEGMVFIGLDNVLAVWKI